MENRAIHPSHRRKGRDRRAHGVAPLSRSSIRVKNTERFGLAGERSRRQDLKPARCISRWCPTRAVLATQFALSGQRVRRSRSGPSPMLLLRAGLSAGAVSQWHEGCLCELKQTAAGAASDLAMPAIFGTSFFKQSGRVSQVQRQRHPCSPHAPNTHPHPPSALYAILCPGSPRRSSARARSRQCSG